MGSHDAASIRPLKLNITIKGDARSPHECQTTRVLPGSVFEGVPQNL